MKCQGCQIEMPDDSSAKLCDRCLAKPFEVAYVFGSKPDDDLRDKVAMAAMQTWLSVLSARYANLSRKDEDIVEEAKYLAFVSADAYMTERARRREGR